MTEEQPTRFDETIPGGRYLAADGKTFVDAWGNKVDPPKDDQPEPKASKPKAAAKGGE